MDISLKKSEIVFKNLVNKYNNSLYDTYESEDDEEYTLKINMYNAS